MKLKKENSNMESRNGRQLKQKRKQSIEIYVEGSRYFVKPDAAYALGLISVKRFMNSRSNNEMVEISQGQFNQLSRDESKEAKVYENNQRRDASRTSENTGSSAHEPGKASLPSKRHVRNILGPDGKPMLPENGEDIKKEGDTPEKDKHIQNPYMKLVESGNLPRLEEMQRETERYAKTTGDSSEMAVRLVQISDAIKELKENHPERIEEFNKKKQKGAEELTIQEQLKKIFGDLNLSEVNGAKERFEEGVREEEKDITRDDD